MSSTTVVVSQNAAPAPAAHNDSDGALNPEEVKITDACCCCYEACYVGPGCFGCSYKDECCCCYEAFCCKIGASPLCCNFGDGLPEGACCQLGCGCYSCGLRMPRTLCSMVAQCCCMVQAGAFPCTDEVPCMLASCCFMCYPAMGVCKTLADTKPKAAVAPATTTVVVVNNSSAPAQAAGAGSGADAAPAPTQEAPAQANS